MKLCEEENKYWDVRQDEAEEFPNMGQLVKGKRKSAMMSMLKRVDDVADKENIFHRTNLPNTQRWKAHGTYRRTAITNPPSSTPRHVHLERR